MSNAEIESFLKKYQTAKAYNSKEIRLTISEAEQLTVALSLLLSQNSTLATKVIYLQEKLLEDKSEIKITGGNF